MFWRPCPAGLSLLSDAENLGQDGLELFGVSRICEKRREDTRARALYEKSIASFLPIETDRAARRSLARLAKRQGDFAWPVISGTMHLVIHGMAMKRISSWRFITNIELAIRSKLNTSSGRRLINFAAPFR